MATSTETTEKTTASVESLKMSSKNPSLRSSKNVSTESVLSEKKKDMKGIKKDVSLDKKDTTVIIKEECIARSPPVKKITMMPPNINTDFEENKNGTKVVHSQNELVASTPNQRNWRGILIALLVIAAVLGLIVFSIALLSPASEGARFKGRRPTLEAILSDRYKYKPFNGTWISDTELVFRDRFGGLAVMNADNLTTRLLMSNSTFRELNAVDYKVSSNMKYVLLISDVRKVFQYTFLARYHVYEIQTRTKFSLSPIEDDREAPLLQYAEWSPDGNAVVFVHDNDIYYKPRVLKSLVCRITTTGVPGVIFNGVPDYLYETEIIRKDHAMWFSADSQYLMFTTYNDSKVGEHKWAWYGGHDQVDPLKYPEIRSVRYPKANTDNPGVSIFTVNLKTPKYLFPSRIQMSNSVEPDSYIMFSSWIAERQVAILTLNRVQNFSIISVCKTPQFNCQDIYPEKAQSQMWSTLGGDPKVREGPPFLFGQNVKGFLTLSSVQDGDAGGYTHIIYVDLATARFIPITLGKFEVTSLLTWDEENSFVYFMATPERKPGQRHMYKIKLQSTKPTEDEGIMRGYPNDNTPATSMWGDMITMKCLTCPLESGVETFGPTVEDQPTTTQINEEDTTMFTGTETEDELNVTDAVTLKPTDASLLKSTSPINGAAKSYAHLNVAGRRNGVIYLNETIPNNCLYNRIIFSAKARYYVQECLGPESPSVYLAETLTNYRVLILHSGAQLRERVAGLAQPQMRSFQVEVLHGYHAQVRLFLPPGLREYEEMPYPLVLQVDASPGSQLVSEKFYIDWAWYLSSTKNFIVAQIDGRGSGFQGDNLRKEIYHRLGTVEVEDQIAVLTYLRDNLKIIDSTRICVWGIGYGGHVASMMTAQDSVNLTRCTVTIAPIVTWAYHTSFFTERYLGSGTPSGNYRGYEAADLTRRAGNFAGRSVLLATALADVTVPAQHSIALARALVNQGVMFRHQIYPDEDHSFGESVTHLYKNIEAFFDEAFGPLEFNDWDLGTSFFTFKQ